MKKSKRIAALALIGVIAVGTLGTGVASAASGGGSVGGGYWRWSNIPGITCTSSYSHASKLHSASARVGSGSTIKIIKVAGNTATATAYGVGTTYVNWNTY